MAVAYITNNYVLSLFVIFIRSFSNAALRLLKIGALNIKNFEMTFDIQHYL